MRMSFFLSLCIGFLLAACGNAEPAPTATIAPSASAAEAAPIDTAGTAAVAMPDAPAPSPTPQASPAGKPANAPTAAAQAKPAPVAQAPAPAEAKAADTPAPPATAAESKPDHGLWDALLQQHVRSDGRVSYAGLKVDMADLQAYLDQLAERPIQPNWSRGEKMAYWINAYNAFTVKLILDNYPLKSITALDGGKPWDVKRIQLGGKTYSLNGIENDILRPQYKDARIHFAVNCAAKSCPQLHNRAYTASNLESLLDKSARAFINNAKFNTLAADKVEVSKIFDWYAADFGASLPAYLSQYAKTEISPTAQVSFKEYDWALNE